MKFTTKGRITLLRDGVAISTHILAEEAYERAYAHALANGPGKYTVRYPDREVDLSTLTRVVLEAAPANLQAQAISASAINLTWTANSRAASYRVYRNGTLIGSPTANSYSDSGLTASTSYTYTVSTVSGSTGEGPQSAGVQGTTLAAPDTTAPTAPVITATATGQNTISVALTTPATDTQSGVASYDLEYKRAVDPTYTVVQPVTAGQFPYIISGLTAATQYNTRSRARDGVGNIGAYSTVSNATTQASTGTANALYSALDMAIIPFHNGSGAWGSQLAFQTATPPTITSESTASTLSALQAAMQIPGRRVTITANISGIVDPTSVQDVEVVVPNGILLNGVIWGRGSTAAPCNRLRITKAPGDAIGGQIHVVRTLFGSINDLIVDGLQLSGPAGGENLAIYLGSMTGVINRVAILRNRIRAGRGGFGYGASHMLVAGNSMEHAASVGSLDGAWGFRNGDTRGPYIYFQNDFRGTRFAKIRFHPASGSGQYYAYLGENTTVDRNENRSIDFNDTASSESYPQISGGWLIGNRIYVSGGGGMGMVRGNFAPTCLYMSQRDNVVWGSSSYLTTGGAPISDVANNTQNAALGTDPPWGAAGDPTGINWNI